jgi:hypothetical protein
MSDGMQEGRGEEKDMQESNDSFEESFQKSAHKLKSIKSQSSVIASRPFHPQTEGIKKHFLFTFVHYKQREKDTKGTNDSSSPLLFA